MARFKTQASVSQGMVRQTITSSFRGSPFGEPGLLASSAIRGPVAAHKLNSRDLTTPRLMRPALSLPVSQTFCSRVLPPASNATTRARSSVSHRCSNNKLTQNCSQTTAHELPDCSSALKIGYQPRRSSPSQDRVSRNTYNGAHSLSFAFPQQAPRRISPGFIFEVHISEDSHFGRSTSGHKALSVTNRTLALRRSGVTIPQIRIDEGKLSTAASFAFVAAACRPAGFPWTDDGWCTRFASIGHPSPRRTSRLIAVPVWDYQQDLAKEGVQRRASRSHERNARATVVQLLTSSTPVRLRRMPLLNQQS
jgi:hypothetical protein